VGRQKIRFPELRSLTYAHDKPMWKRDSTGHMGSMSTGPKCNRTCTYERGARTEPKRPDVLIITLMSIMCSDYDVDSGTKRSLCVSLRM